jgi:hypothetical protein
MLCIWVWTFLWLHKQVPGDEHVHDWRPARGPGKYHTPHNPTAPHPHTPTPPHPHTPTPTPPHPHITAPYGVRWGCGVGLWGSKYHTPTPPPPSTPPHPPPPHPAPPRPLMAPYGHLRPLLGFCFWCWAHEGGGVQGSGFSVVVVEMGMHMVCMFLNSNDNIGNCNRQHRQLQQTT